MNEEKNKYSIVGKVEIGADEYRELIEKSIEYEKAYDMLRSEKWKLEDELSKVKYELKLVKLTCEKYLEFINSSEEMKTKYKLFLAEKQIREQEGEENI